MRFLFGMSVLFLNKKEGGFSLGSGPFTGLLSRVKPGGLGLGGEGD